MKPKTKMLCSFATLLLIVLASYSIACAQTTEEQSTTAPSTETLGPLPSFPSPPDPSAPPAASVGSGFSSGGVPGSKTPAMGQSFPSSAVPVWPGSLSSSGPYSGSSGTTMPSNPYSGRESGSFGTYAPSYSYPGLSGSSGSSGQFGPSPGSMGTGTVGSTVPGSMLESQSGVYGYPAGVPGTPLGAASRRRGR